MIALGCPDLFDGFSVCEFHRSVGSSVDVVSAMWKSAESLDGSWNLSVSAVG